MRLRNWVGDVVLGVPALRLLAARGYSLRLIGKPWARALLAAEGWSVEPLASGGWRARLAQLRRLRREARAEDAGFDERLNTLLLPFSFSSALDARLAGLRAIGYAHEGRSPLLARALPRHRGEHELRAYWRIASALAGHEGGPPPAIALAVDAEARERALRRLETAGISGPFVVICPFAGGTFEGLDKRWPDFPAFTAAATRDWGLPLVVCPGPGEVGAARGEHAAARLFEGVGLDEYAALLERATLMVSNDTGPGHLAAAVGTPLVCVLGPTDAGQWGPWGPSAHVVQRAGGWPSTREVLDAGQRLLAAREAA